MFKTYIVKRTCEVFLIYIITYTNDLSIAFLQKRCRRNKLRQHSFLSVSDDIIFLENLFSVRSLDLFEELFDSESFDKVIVHIGDLFAVAKLYGRIEQCTDIIDASPYFGYASVNIEESVNRFHTCTHRILGGEDSITLCFCELSEECEVYCALRNNIGAVAVLTGHKECCDIWHHARNSVCAVFGEVFDLIFGNADMIEPFHTDLFACAVTHRLLYIVADLIGEECIYPDEALILRLASELRLTVYCPA